MRYIIGIDLGTTNTTVAYIDTQKDLRHVQIFQISQTTYEGTVRKFPSLPSFCYLESSGDFGQGALDLPWKKNQKYTVGKFALKYGAQVPTGLVSSAKSWLCYHSANQKEAILPVEARDDTSRISPIEASRRYLDHIREAWNHSMAKGNPEDELEQQEIILTVPASFDEVARALTAEAAKGAGFEKITFIEEPQAAFYNWIAQNESSWENAFEADQSILVCDVGGGTTDFSLIRYSKTGETGSFERMAVGDHLLLGGDNIDHALAFYLQEKIENDLDIHVGHDQWKKLYHEARCAKEAILSGEVDSYQVTIQGKGSSVIGGSLSIELQKEEVVRQLNEGFFPVAAWDEAKDLHKAKGLRTSGLPYEDDPCITKQLAHFLETSCTNYEDLPRYILFNGGTMMAQSFQDAIIESYRKWFPDISLTQLNVKNMEQAVSKGASYYGRVRRGDGVKIRAGSPRSFYLELDVASESSTKKALCLLARGTEEGTVHESTRQFTALANTPVNFTLYASHTRMGDIPGDIIEIDTTELLRLPPISTILRFGKKGLNTTQKEISVNIGVEYTTLGTLDMWLDSNSSDHRWNLEFQLKSSTGQEDQLSLTQEGRRDETFNAEYLEESKKIIDDLFTPGGTTKPEKVVDALEQLLDKPRGDWSPSILRGLWTTLIEKAKNRKLSPKHEARWWNLAGFFLRPGFGFPLDDHRVKDLWKVILGEMQQKVSDEVAVQKCICLRRVAGGLNKGQQTQVFHQIMPSIYNKKTGRLELPKGCDHYQYNEKLRTLAALERIDFKSKKALGNALINTVVKRKKGSNDEISALGRLGTREPLYVSRANVLPVEDVVHWVEALLPISKGEKQAFSLALIVRKSNHYELNVNTELREKVKALSESNHLHQMIDGVEELTSKEQIAVLGDHLPPGIVLQAVH